MRKSNHFILSLSGHNGLGARARCHGPQLDLSGLPRLALRTLQGPPLSAHLLRDLPQEAGKQKRHGHLVPNVQAEDRIL